MLRRLADLIVARPWSVLAVGLILAVGGTILGFSLVRLDADTDSLISPTRPFMKRYDAFKRRFGDLERMWVVVDGGDNEAASRRVVDWIEPRLASLEFPQIVARVDVPEQVRLTAWSSSAAEIDAIVDACAVLGNAASGDGRSAESVLAAAATDLQRATSLIGPDRDERMRLARGAITTLQLVTGHGLPTDDQYLTSPSGRLHFIGVLPHKDYGTLSVIEQPLAAVRNVLDQARHEFPNVDIGLTGKPVLQADEMRTSNADMTKAAIVAMVLVTALVIALLGQWRRPLLAVVAFAMAVGWTWGFVAISTGRLTLLSIVFLLVMIGVGLDFGVHVVSRHSAVRATLGRDRSLREVLETTGRANVVAALTSMAVFLAALATDFRGLQELGIIAAVGIGLSVVAMSTMLPALLVIFDRFITASPPPPKPPRAVQRPRIVLWLVVVTGLVGWYFASQLHFETNLLALQAPGLPASTWERRIAEDAGAPTWFAAMEAKDLQAAAELTRAANAEPLIGRVRSVLDVISPEDLGQTEARMHLANCTTQPVVAGSPESKTQVILALRAASAAAQTDHRDDAEELAALADQIQGMSVSQIDHGVLRAQVFLADAKAGAAMSLREVLPDSIARESISPDGTLLVMVHPVEDVWDEPAMARFVAAIRRVDSDVTGVPITHLESLRDMRSGFRTMTMVAAGLVVLILILEARGWREPLVCIVALAIGAGWTLGMADLVGLHLNLANFFGVPVLLGLGIDGAVHIAHRIRHGETDGSTRRAVLLTGLTTMVGFGSLLLASHRGLASLGGLMAIGCLAFLVSSLLVVPVALQWWRRSSN